VESAVVTALDITEARAAELKFRRIFESGVVAIAIGDGSGKVVEANDAFLELVGYQRGELQQGIELPVLDSNGHIKPYEKELRHRDGRKIPVLIATAHIDDRTVGIIVDVSERRALEQRRDQLLEELRRSVDTSKLFVGVVAHDLRNPLNAMLMGSQALIRSEPTEQQARIINRISRSGERMHRMIEQLLDFTQIRMGGALPMQPSSCDLTTVCREVIDEIQDAFEGAKVSLTVTGDPSGQWDPARLEQALSNLLSNAVHHGVDGRADVTIDGQSDERVLIQVHNLGVIPSDLIPTVFDPLQRGDSSSHGLGLGLFITKTIARQHGGEVSVISNREAGTKFTLELPRRSTAHEELRPREAHPLT
jgi:PAS domain S-box-containing protein